MKVFKNLILYSTHHPLSAKQVSSPQLKQFLRYRADNFKMPKFLNNHDSLLWKNKMFFFFFFFFFLNLVR